MKLTEHFNLGEFLPPDTLESDVPQDVLHNLRVWCAIIGEPLREAIGHPIRVTSGWRPPDYNAKKGGVVKSDHERGLAVDFQVHPEKDTPSWEQATMDAWKWVAANLPGKFGQLIFEDHRQVTKVRTKLWVHCSLTTAKHSGDERDANRLLFSFEKGRYHPTDEGLFG